MCLDIMSRSGTKRAHGARLKILSMAISQEWNGEDHIFTRTFNSPSEIFKAAKEIIASQNGSDQ
jgi:hypothetical protein